MKRTNLTEGMEQFGPAYRSYDYFLLKHAASYLDVRNDQGHFYSAFITFHSAFLLEFENALLAVDPSIEALPYWDASQQTPSVFTEELLGSCPGSGPDQTVVDGSFPNWPVPRASLLAALREEIRTFFPTSNVSVEYVRGNQYGFVRGPVNHKNNTVTT